LFEIWLEQSLLDDKLKVRVGSIVADSEFYISDVANDNLIILAAIFNGSPANPNAADPQADNRHGTEFRLEDPPLIMVEGQFKYDVGLPGTVKLGGWKQLNHYAPEFLNPAIFDTSYGLYGVIDQQIWKGSDDKGISVFARVSGSRTNRT
jgi:porin